MTENSSNTEAIILEAAKKVFKQKGYDGTTVQDIATEAGTTKSMVNYYFRSKDKLFSSVFMGEFKIFFSGLAMFIQSDLPLKEKIEKIINYDTEKFIEFPELPVFILNEINRNTAMVFEMISEMKPGGLVSIIQEQIDKEAKKGTIKKIKAEDLILNLQALTIFPYLARPLMQRVFNISDTEYKKKLSERRKAIVDIIWSYLSN